MRQCSEQLALHVLRNRINAREVRRYREGNSGVGRQRVVLPGKSKHAKGNKAGFM